MEQQHEDEQGRGGALPGWSIELIQIAITILLTMIAYFVLMQYGAG